MKKTLFILIFNLLLSPLYLSCSKNVINIDDYIIETGDILNDVPIVYLTIPADFDKLKPTTSTDWFYSGNPLLYDGNISYDEAKLFSEKYNCYISLEKESYTLYGTNYKSYTYKTPNVSKFNYNLEDASGISVLAYFTTLQVYNVTNKKNNNFFKLYIPTKDTYFGVYKLSD